MSRKVLFVCTGNYYRSRFAEHLFNALAAQRGLAWTAESRGFVLSPQNAGPISTLTLQELAASGYPLAEPARSPIVLGEEDLASADLIVALKEAEHRTRFERHFPEWVDRVEYWHVHDLDVTPAPEAFALIRSEVERLIERLEANPSAGR